MNKIVSRTVQVILKALSNILDWSEPELHVGAGKFQELPQILRRMKLKKLLIVTDKGILKAGLMDTFIEKLETIGINI